jgi:hypothetical protein
MPTDTEDWRMIGLLLALCGVGIITAHQVGQMLAASAALALP